MLRFPETHRQAREIRRAEGCRLAYRRSRNRDLQNVRLKLQEGIVRGGSAIDAKFVEEGESRITRALHGEEYNSHNTTRLDVEGMKKLLLRLEFMQKVARGEPALLEG